MDLGPLASGEVRIHAVRLGTESAPSWLPEAVRARGDRFRDPRHREAFLLAHAFLRRVLGGYLGGGPYLGDLAAGPQGKPFLPGLPLHFSFARAEGLAACALGLDLEVGLDLESADRLGDPETVAAAVLGPGEAAALPRGRAAALLRAWAAKEALLKLDGRGLGLDPRTVAVGPAAWEGEAWTGTLEGRQAHVRILPVDGAVAALATWEAPSRVTVFVPEAGARSMGAGARPAGGGS